MERGTGTAVVKDGGKSWYFLTADYAFGHDLEKEASNFVKQRGGLHSKKRAKGIYVYKNIRKTN